MKLRNLLPVVFLLFLVAACHITNSFMTTRIKEILDHPRDYENKEVTVSGTVANPISLLVIKYFDLKDDTGTIKVVTDKVLPAKGEKMTVIGKVAVMELGTERLIVVQEKSDKPPQK